MKALKYILIFIITLTFYNLSNSQSLEVEESMFNNSFTSKKLTAFQLKGFEKRAAQKITDYANYIKIISDKSYNLSLRKHALKLTKELFIDENVTVQLFNNKISKEKTVKISEFLHDILNSNYSKITLKTSEITTTENLKTDKKGVYKGKMTYNVIINYFKNKKLIFTDKLEREIEINLIKINKKFGTSQTKVRSILLGSID